MTHQAVAGAGADGRPGDDDPVRAEDARGDRGRRHYLSDIGEPRFRSRGVDAEEGELVVPVQGVGREAEAAEAQGTREGGLETRLRLWQVARRKVGDAAGRVVDAGDIVLEVSETNSRDGANPSDADDRDLGCHRAACPMASRAMPLVLSKR